MIRSNKVFGFNIFGGSDVKCYPFSASERGIFISQVLVGLIKITVKWILMQLSYILYKSYNQIIPNTPAAEANLRVGDRIIKVIRRRDTFFL